MNFVTLRYVDKMYIYNGGSDVSTYILGEFLSNDARCMNVNFYKEWVLDNAYNTAEGNATLLEKKNGYIYLNNLFSQEKTPTILKMTTEQFIQILEDWDAKVCKARPQEVTIKYENDQFTIEIPH